MLQQHIAQCMHDLRKTLLQTSSTLGPYHQRTSCSAGGMLPGTSAVASTLANARKVFVKSAPSSYISVSRFTWAQGIYQAHTQKTRVGY